MARLNPKKGILLAGIGVFVLSFDATLLRLAEASPWNAAFWRGVFIALALVIYLMMAGRNKEWHGLRQFRFRAVGVCALYGFNIALFVFSVNYTSVANTVVILCLSPFFSAFFSWFLLREKIARFTWFTIIIATVGVAIIFLGESEEGNHLGNVLAFVLAASTGLLFTYLRCHPEMPRIPAIAVGAFISVLILFPFASPFQVSGISLGWLALMGLAQKPLASVLMLSSTRFIPSAEVSLFLVLESLLAPMWAWLFTQEQIPKFTFFGGGIVLLVVFFHCIWQIRKKS